MAIVLCATSEIADPGSKSFQLNDKGYILDIFVVHKDARFHAFINRCPHTGINLEWQEDRFLDIDHAFIQCATHDALFEIENGRCIHGPCAGESLSVIVIEVVDNMLVAQI